MLTTLFPLVLIIAGVTGYGFFVFRFYRLLVRRDMFTLDLDRYSESSRPVLRKTLSAVLYVLLYLIVYPVVVFVWFMVIAALLYVVSSDRPIETTMLTAMGVVGAIRVCCYYSEALATDIAKVVPLGLLSFMLLNNTLNIGDMEGSVRYAQSLLTDFEGTLQLETLAYYLVAVIVIEFVLRLLSRGVIPLIKR